MSKVVLLTLLLSTFSVALLGQGKPRWIQQTERERSFPSKTFFTGYAQGNVRKDESVEDAKNRLLKDALGLLSENIRITVRSQTESRTVSTTTNNVQRFDAVFASDVQTVSDIELVGLRSEPPYYDSETAIIHAFVYVNRHDLASFYKSALAMNIAQAESFMQTAQNLETASDKVQARRQCEVANLSLTEARAAQILLTAIEPSITHSELLFAKTEELHDRLVQMQARLAQAVYVYMKSDESNFSKATTVLGNRLKSELSAKGCSFTDDPTLADFRVFVNATTRHHGSEFGFIVCYADVAVQLFDVRKDKSVFQDEFSQKGISTSLETAGRKALEDAVPIIVNKISEWIL